MKRAITLILAVALPAVLALPAMAVQKPKENLRHVVVFKYKQGASQDQIREVTDAFRQLKDKIEGIVSFEHGINNSSEGLSRGFTHVYVVTFEDAKARDAYLPHPEHKKFTDLLGRLNILEEVFVVDFVPGD